VTLRHTLEIAPDHPAFDGHFPGTPILPGAVLLDEALRFIEVDLALDLTQWQIANAKFLERVRPGDALTVEHSGPANGLVRFTVRIAHRAGVAMPGVAMPALSGTLAAMRVAGASDA
jgi:3-hydroxymyristoyl/3-hydroxydecanoyl-(acyl carrier protein) dehydratase